MADKKALIVVQSFGNCYPSIAYEEIRTAEQFENFLKEPAFVDASYQKTWEQLMRDDAYEIQGLLNSSEERDEDTEYLVRLVM